jgi:hypothetical protein
MSNEALQQSLPAETSEVEIDATEIPSAPEVPDLSDVPGSELRKLTEALICRAEFDGHVYAPVFRQLQIRPDRYYDFHNGVVRVIRVKHSDEIKRSSDASIKNLAGLMLRAFGYIVWAPKSTWLLDETELEEGEARLVYLKGRTHVPDERYRSFYKSSRRTYLTIPCTQILSAFRVFVSPDAQFHVHAPNSRQESKSPINPVFHSHRYRGSGSLHQ